VRAGHAARAIAMASASGYNAFGDIGTTLPEKIGLF
jgi:hypothetical protein